MRSSTEPVGGAFRLVRFEVDLLTIDLPRPLAISFHSMRRQENFFVRLHDSDGGVGWGEGAPLQAITGDSLEEALDEARRLQARTMPLVESPGAFHREFISGLSSSTLRAALDFAVQDLAAQRAGLPVYRLFCERPRRIDNAVTVFIQESPRQSRREAARLLARHPHARILKIKLAGAGDRERCLAVAEASPAGMRFILDANQGFDDPKRAAEEIAWIADRLGEVILVEEPCRKRDWEAMAEVRRRLGGVKVFADESCAGEADLERIIGSGCADGVNIKLQKAGGIVPARRMAARAAQAGLEVMLGAMFETALSHCAGAHFAVSTPNVLLTDLDMDLDLPDFCRGRLPFEDGIRRPFDTPGFGFELVPEKLGSLENVSLSKVVDCAVRSTANH